MVAEAGSLSEGICHCRHIKEHLGQRCAMPITHCLSLGTGADYLVGAGLAKRIDQARALEILAYSRANDMVMMADNVREKPTFICNCCKCCCEMLWGFRTLREQPRLVTSNFVARVSAQECSGCGNCAKACPVEVIDLVPAEPTPKHRSRKQAAQVNEGLCLGCGVCHRQCKTKALRLHPTGERVHTPATLIEKLMVQALERGKIQHFIFDDPSKITHRALGAVLSALVNLPPSKKLLAQKQIKSRVMQLLLMGFGRTKAAKAVEI
jgi:ferredoxin